ncbi:hypothetical protein [Chitinophaga caeni]|nr:hypothetical protein [Chitinophaga caeni]
MTSKVIVEGQVVTGQNPFSSKEMTKIVIQELEKQMDLQCIIYRMA